MSAFMVDDKTINRIVSYLFQERTTSHTQRRLKEEEAIHDEAALGVEMFALNAAGVNARYGDGEAAQFRPLDYRYDYELSTKIQALKSLRCWLYQCSEGDVPETTLYKIMDEYSAHLALDIISDLPAWNAAEWA